MTSRQLRKYCVIDQQSIELLKEAVTNLNLSARAYDRILKVARTIADLVGSPRTQSEHLAEAVQYRASEIILSTSTAKAAHPATPAAV
jgi:magnesium chelatase family protein